MGLGTKIKEAMHGDKETTSQQSPTTTSSHNKTPGAFPAEDVPRTSTVPAGSAGEPRTEKLHGKHSPDYTHSSGKDSSSLTGAGTTGTTGSHGGLTGSERRHEGGLSQHGTSGMTGSNTTGVPHTGTTGTSHTNTTGTHGHNKLTKDVPYDEYGSTTSGTHGRSHNDGLTSGHQGTHGAHGTTGTAGAPTGTHGTHNSRVANAADPRIDSDRDHRAAAGSYAAPGMSSPNHGTTGMTGSHGTDSTTMTGANTGMTGSTHGTGMTGSNHGTGSHSGSHSGNHNGTPGMMTGATGTHDNRQVHYEDRINPRSPTTPGSDLTDSNHGPRTFPGSNHGTTGGMTGGSNNMMRDHNVDEYDAPSNSSGRGHAGQGGLAGAAGSVAASELSNRHHKDDMHSYNTPGAGASSTDRGLNTTDRWHNSAPHGAGADPTMMGGNNMNTNTGGVYSGTTGGMMDGTTSRGVNDSSIPSGTSPSLMGTTHMNPTSTTHTGTGHGHTGSMGNNHTSMLDPHNETNRTTYGTDNSGIGSHHSHHGHRAESNGMATGMAPHMAGGGLATNEYAAGPPHQQQHQSGMPGGNHGGVLPHDNTRGGIPHEAGLNNQHMGNVSPTGNNTSSHHNTSGSGSGMGMGAMANSLPGMGDGHHGPGHASAKVLHSCDHCGNDNDISRYFSKEAAYRMS